MRKIVYVNPHVCTEGKLGDLRLPEAYSLTGKFFFCGIIDRTGTLDTGFPYQVLDPIPDPQDATPSFHALCLQRGHDLVSEAIESEQAIQVLWSGGIDSTVALIALLTAARQRERLDLLEVLLSLESVHENPRFFAAFIQNKLRVVPVAHPVFRFLEDEKLIVTGEHGDQLFGSDYLSTYVAAGTAEWPYADLLPLIVANKLGDSRQVDVVLEYLKPQIDTAPVPIVSLFDLFWWLNFSLKWQHVTMRTAVYRRKNVHQTYKALRHFFRDSRFQQWALSNRANTVVTDWQDYKQQARQFILDFTGDEEYYNQKKKEVSLHAYSAKAIANRGRLREMIYMYDDFQPHYEVFEKQEPWQF